MRAALLAAARGLFVTQGYAATGTPEIVAAAGVTRGALYHHFADKAALFHAVVEAEAASVADAVRAADFDGMTPMAALVRGGEAFLQTMTEPGRIRLLLLDGPAVLGREEMDRIDARFGGRTLREGLAAALPAGAPLDDEAALLSAAYDRAAMRIAQGADPRGVQDALAAMLRGICG